MPLIREGHNHQRLGRLGGSLSGTQATPPPTPIGGGSVMGLGNDSRCSLDQWSDANICVPPGRHEALAAGFRQIGEAIGHQQR
jgi:hypothetical protein